MTARRGKPTVTTLHQCSLCGTRTTQAEGLVAAMRQQAGISQSELARRMGVAQSRVVRLEQQGPNLKLTTLQRAARACGLVLTVGYDHHDTNVIEKPRSIEGYDIDVMV